MKKILYSDFSKGLLAGICLIIATYKLISYQNLKTEYQKNIKSVSIAQVASQLDITPSFDTNFSHINIEEIKSGGPAKDGIPALTNPKFINVANVDYLLPDDEIIGVTIGNKAKAYPLRILDWHEIVNDNINDQPIVVTYCPLCKSALVFDRHVDGKTLEFGVSGLLWNSNVLMYDRQNDPHQESLWSQIQMKAVTGPAAEKNHSLELLASKVTTWKKWKTMHHNTEVLSLDTGFQRRYKSKAYVSYFSTDQLMFPVTQHGLQPKRFKNKEPMVLIQYNNIMKAYALKDIENQINENDYVKDTIANNEICINYDRASKFTTFQLMDNKEHPIPVATMFWFSLNALLPEVEIYSPPGHS